MQHAAVQHAAFGSSPSLWAVPGVADVSSGGACWHLLHVWGGELSECKPCMPCPAGAD